jgi:hypothetical protein
VTTYNNEYTPEPLSQDDLDRDVKLALLQQDYEKALARVEAEQGAALTACLQEIKENNCYHPKSKLWTSVENCDDGYGRWWKVGSTKCRLCGKILNVNYNA